MEIYMLNQKKKKKKKKMAVVSVTFFQLFSF